MDEDEQYYVDDFLEGYEDLCRQCGLRVDGSTLRWLGPESNPADDNVLAAHIERLQVPPPPRPGEGD